MKKLVVGICLFMLVGCDEPSNGPTYVSPYKVGDKVEFVMDGRGGQVRCVHTIYGARPGYSYSVYTTVNEGYRGGNPYMVLHFIKEYEIKKAEESK